MSENYTVLESENVTLSSELNEMNEHNVQLLDKYKTALSRTEGKKAKIAGLKREMENTEAALAKKTGDLESTKADLKTKMEQHREETLALKTTINEEKQRRIDDVKAKNIELLENYHDFVS